MEIERKFLIKDIPDLSSITPVRYERYYIKRAPGFEERIQKKDDVFEYEIKKEISNLERTKDKRIITEKEFNAFKNQVTESIIRDSYKINSTISIKKYYGKFVGLVRAEVEFDSIEKAKNFVPEVWMGKEITDSPLGRDAKLLDLSEGDFKSLINK